MTIIYTSHYLEQAEIFCDRIAILDKEEIPPLLEKIPTNMDLEINISCPNIQHSLVSDNIHIFINPDRKWCSIKLSPTTDISLIDKYYQQGFRKFHFFQYIFYH